MIVKINNFRWLVQFVNKADALMIEEGCYYLGQTEFGALKINIRNDLSKELTRATILHELCHSYLFSYGVQQENYSEELVCDFFAAHADSMVTVADKIMKGWGE